MIRTVLGALNITSGPSNDHEHHFHVDFRAPGRVQIPQNLLAPEVSDAAADGPAWLGDALVELNLSKEDAMVFTLDFPEQAQSVNPVAMVAKAGQTVTPDGARMVGVCLGINYDPTGLQNSFSRFMP